ncbi:hypothetical protein F4802DRAFT_459716 [Xylaria palmicola]|nr:hypothetical protein F4802DRAFT_459716 [Xylaria palmicola]
MSARVFQATRLLTRQRQRVLAGSCVGLALGTGLAIRSTPPTRFDHHASPSPSPLTAASSSSSDAAPRTRGDDALPPALMSQLSGGSVAGFLSGLLVSVFSRTLVLLLGVSVVLVQVAARYGIDIIDQLRLRQRLGKSRVLAALEKDPVFKLSFGVFFALSGFMQF